MSFGIGFPAGGSGRPTHAVMNALAHAVLLAWMPIALAAFARLQSLQAVLFILLGGWLFLPVLGIDLPTIPDYDKATAVTYSLLLGILAFDSGRFTNWRPSAIDLAFGMWILSAPAASLANGHGFYDAMTAFLLRFFHWGVPYFVGTLYLTSKESLRLALWAVFVGGLLYAPLCLYEIRMSPQLHRMLYGAFQHQFDQTVRGGGFRPVVFTRHGLEVSLFMASATIAGVGLWRLLGVAKVRGMPMGALVVFLAISFVLCKSTGAFFLGFLGCLMMLPGIGRTLRLGMLALIPLFLVIRLWGAGLIEQWMLDQARLVSEDRAASLQYRFDCEQMLLARFWQQPWFGLSPWSFNLHFNAETGEVTNITSDSMWIIAVVVNGMVGLLGFVGLLWLPVLRAQFSRSAESLRSHPEFVIAGIIVTIYLVDNLFNAFTNPIYLALAGGLSRVPLRSTELVAAAVPGPVESTASSLLLPRQPTPAPLQRSHTDWLLPRDQPPGSG